VKIIADTNIPFVSQCFSSIGDVCVCPGREIGPEVVRDADVLLVRSITPVGAELLAGSSVRFVGTATIGFEHIDREYLTQQGIGFASAPGSNANSVAEYIVAVLLRLGEKYTLQLSGKSIGVIGVGNVGSMVVRKCTALGMEVRLNDPPLQRQTGDAKYLPLKELFDCDFITLHPPLTFEGIDKTFHLAGETFFNSLKKGAFFINTSRGGVVDTSALKAAMDAGRLGGVVLDVWENEPCIDAELLAKVDIATPHIAGYSFDGKVAGVIMIYNAVCKYFGMQPQYAAEDFLGEPGVAEIKIGPDSHNEQDIVCRSVRQLYNIDKDDSNTRKILTVPPEKRGKFFDELRKNYTIRREFQNTRIVIADSVEGIANSKKPSAKRCLLNAAEKLKGIGFTVKYSN